MLKLVCPMIFIKRFCHFKHSKITGYHPTDGRTDGPTDGRTDGRTDGPTDGRTDTPSYRDGWTHLKSTEVDPITYKRFQLHSISQTFHPSANRAQNQKLIRTCRELMKGLDTMELSHTSMCAAVFGLWVTTVLETMEKS